MERFILCHIPSSKRQQDATDYERGRQDGEGRGLTGSDCCVAACPDLLTFGNQAGVGKTRLTVQNNCPE